MNLLYEKILNPVCDSFSSPHIDCFRTIDELDTGNIELVMYKWIFNADIAIVVISTLNVITIYEIVVRYAGQRPRTLHNSMSGYPTTLITRFI